MGTSLYLRDHHFPGGVFQNRHDPLCQMQRSHGERLCSLAMAAPSNAAAADRGSENDNSGWSVAKPRTRPPAGARASAAAKAPDRAVQKHLLSSQEIFLGKRSCKLGDGVVTDCDDDDVRVAEDGRIFPGGPENPREASRGRGAICAARMNGRNGNTHPRKFMASSHGTCTNDEYLWRRNGHGW